MKRLVFAVLAFLLIYTIARALPELLGNLLLSVVPHT